MPGRLESRNSQIQTSCKTDRSDWIRVVPDRQAVHAFATSNRKAAVLNFARTDQYFRGFSLVENVSNSRREFRLDWRKIIGHQPAVSPDTPKIDTYVRHPADPIL
jgi:hypothetical protein